MERSFLCRTQLFHIVGNSHIEEPGVVADRVESQLCSCDMFSRVNGFKYCSTLSYPKKSAIPMAPNFLLAGPMRARIVIEKTDRTLRSYELMMKWSSTEVCLCVCCSRKYRTALCCNY